MKRLLAYWNTSCEYFYRTEETWIYIIFPGLFTFLFLLFFQPFGVNNYDPTEKISPLFFFTMFAMGATVSFGLAFNELVLRPLFIKAPFTQGSRLIWILWTLILLSTLVFLLYNTFGNWHDLYWTSYFQFIGNISAMAILPLGIVFAYFQFRKLKHNPKGEGAPKPDISLLRFSSPNAKDLLVVPAETVVFIESQDNYAAIYYGSHKGLKKHLIRSSLKSLETQLADTSLIRCHRTFIVNIQQVLSYTGNKHGLQLSLKNLGKEIPVSRSYVSLLKEKLPQQSPSMVIHP